MPTFDVADWPGPIVAGASADALREKSGIKLNVAVTAVAALMVAKHDAVPEQAPLQPRKTDPADAAAVSVTATPVTKLAEQVFPQLIPAGVLETLPLPAPAKLTERGNSGKVATFRKALTVSKAEFVTTTSGRPSSFKSAMAKPIPLPPPMM